MIDVNYLYTVNYQSYEKDLCNFEMTAIFGEKKEGKTFCSIKEVDPSISAYIRNRLTVMCKESSLDAVVNWLIDHKLSSSEFMVKYYSLMSDDPEYKNRKKICETIGFRIQGFPNFKAPRITYGITFYEGYWYFGVYIINNQQWREHINKPFSYSSSLGINMAKAAANIASGGDKTKKMIDPCCGVGTVVLEGVFAGYDIVGAEIKSKVAEKARANLEHYGYETIITTCDIGHINEMYDVSIVDLPYGNFSLASGEDQMYIIGHALRISKKLVLIASEDMSERLTLEGMMIEGHCKVSKKAVKSFARYIYILHKDVI